MEGGFEFGFGPDSKNSTPSFHAMAADRRQRLKLKNVEDNPLHSAPSFREDEAATFPPFSRQASLASSRKPKDSPWAALSGKPRR